MCQHLSAPKVTSRRAKSRLASSQVLGNAPLHQPVNGFSLRCVPHKMKTRGKPRSSLSSIPHYITWSQRRHEKRVCRFAQRHSSMCRTVFVSASIVWQSRTFFFTCISPRQLSYCRAGFATEECHVFHASFNLLLPVSTSTFHLVCCMYWTTSSHT